MTFLDQFKAARRVSTPLIAVRTPDPAATVAQIRKEANGSPLLMWDAVRGLSGLNDVGKAVVTKLFGDELPMSANPVETLNRAQRLPEKSILFFLNPQFYVKEPTFVQAVWNLRDSFKQDWRTLVMVSTTLALPPELAQDVILFDEPFPGEDQLAGIVKETYSAVKLPDPKPAVLKRAVASLRGLSSFTAEQVSAMSINGSGLDLDQCWERKYTVIDETDALSVWRKRESFADVEGVQNVKDFLAGVFKGEDPPDLVVFMDEIEKMFAGAQGDLSGTSQQQHGAVLKWMQNNNVLGVMFVGHPGAAKTCVAHACGGEFNVPVVAFDVDAAQASLVGETGEKTRNALKVIDAMGRPLVVATCNSIGTLSPELRRRFQLSTFFFDLPDAYERSAIWNLYLKKYKLDQKFSLRDIPDDEGWTGAEIRTCCDLAWRLRKTLREAAEFVVPVSRSAADRVESLRRQANGRWISASKRGIYQYQEDQRAEKPARAIEIGGAR